MTSRKQISYMEIFVARLPGITYFRPVPPPFSPLNRNF
jgi:hypothetical protein